MAAKTPDTIDPHVAGTGAGGDTNLQSLQGLRHTVVPFLTENVDNGDTFTIPGDGGEVIIVRAAWEAVSGNASCTLLSTTQVLFVSAADDSTGYLHLWTNA